MLAKPVLYANLGTKQGLCFSRTHIVTGFGYVVQVPVSSYVSSRCEQIFLFSTFVSLFRFSLFCIFESYRSVKSIGSYWEVVHYRSNNSLNSTKFLFKCWDECKCLAYGIPALFEIHLCWELNDYIENLLKHIAQPPYNLKKERRRGRVSCVMLCSSIRIIFRIIFQWIFWPPYRSSPIINIQTNLMYVGRWHQKLLKQHVVCIVFNVLISSNCLILVTALMKSYFKEFLFFFLCFLSQKAHMYGFCTSLTDFKQTIPFIQHTFLLFLFYP